MAKNKNIIACVLWLLVSLCADGQSHISGLNNALRRAVIDTALSQVGVREATGKNDGAAVEKYLKACGLGKGYAWCAAFIAWDYKVNGVKALNTAWGPSWFPTNKTLKAGELPQPGDVFGLWINNRIGHVGFVYRYGIQITKTIEGNTNEAGSREGDGVYIKRRLSKQLYKTSRWVN